MTNDARGQSDDLHPQAPWWWGIGPVGAVILVIVGIAWTLWLFLGSSGAADNSTVGYGASKVISIGLVLGGTVVLERFRSRTSRAQETKDQENG
ncbi:hypothetical protein DIZ27_33905 [Streptomyces sp. NWU339]|uniref:hypothetical protein n=1 Tax=Streptomyces sp. NWU339 TaxID=2185284 RepID=UPI000D6736D2|nr:hypothetical protein [Streptomyces sp. NWU339]PWI06351.1 hypothetical protein DIZ27_33905 [Streptomyces sp. NWU339]